MYPFGSLPENLAAFCDVLRRAHRFRIGPGELYDAARALELVDLSDERTVRNTLRPILSATVDDAAVFDRAFTGFFLPSAGERWLDEVKSTRLEPGAETPGSDERVDVERRPAARSAESEDGLETSGAAGASTSESEHEAVVPFARSSYSPLDAVATDAPALTPVDGEWTDAARALVRRLHIGVSRRWRAGSKGQRFDLRRTLRSSLQTGGETLTPRWLRRHKRAPRFVVLIDGSRSMLDYTQAALRLAVALASVTSRVEVFTFSTSLQRITSDARKAAAGETRRVEGLEHSWGGGTSIGVCVRAFLTTFGDRVLGRQTVVIIASDGLDLGDPAALRHTMSELRRRAASIVWLNPLVDTAGYEPTAAGMSAARSYISTFMSVNDARDLARLSRSVRVR